MHQDSTHRHLRVNSGNQASIQQILKLLPVCFARYLTMQLISTVIISSITTRAKTTLPNSREQTYQLSTPNQTLSLGLIMRYTLERMFIGHLQGQKIFGLLACGSTLQYTRYIEVSTDHTTATMLLGSFSSKSLMIILINLSLNEATGEMIT